VPKTESLPIPIMDTTLRKARYLPYCRLLLTSSQYGVDSGLKISGWDGLIGFNAYSYRKRFHIVAALAQEDLIKRGIEVEELIIFATERGIYISWSLQVPTA
jgi:hypothetical protein